EDRRMSPAPPSTIRVYAEGPNGVHGISDEEGARLIRSTFGRSAGREPGPLVWIDILNPGPAEETFLRDVIGFHPLAVEDCVRGRQRPKVDRYNDYLFLVLY